MARPKPSGDTVLIGGEHEAVASPAAEERISVASQWQLMWWRFRRHRLALVGSTVVLTFYFVVLTADFLAYSDPFYSEAYRSLMPPQPIHLLDGGNFKPYVNGIKGKRDPQTFKRIYEADPDTKHYLRLFAPGFRYKLFTVIPTNIHLIGIDGAEAEDTLFVLGTDLQGRDMWSRLIFSTRISMVVGLAAVIISLFLGILLGGLSGYFGGAVDTVIQRVIEILLSVPTIPLWLALAAAMPADWNVVRVYIMITIIISLFGWTGLARVVRGKFLSIREEDFVMAAELVGASRLRVIFHHMVPAFLSHIIATTTLALPAMIISETSLSFLGLGLRPPAISWGVLLQQAQNIQTIALSPWLLIPAIPMIVVILAFNFMGDGLRDAADPYG